MVWSCAFCGQCGICENSEDPVGCHGYRSFRSLSVVERPVWGGSDRARTGRPLPRLGGPSPRFGYGAAVVVVTGVLQKEAWDRDVMPPVEKVRPGVWSIPVPIPDNPLRYVLVYAFELDNGIAIVDAGWNTEDAWSALNTAWPRRAAPSPTCGPCWSPTSTLTTTGWRDGCAGSGAWIGLHPADAAMLRPATSRPTTLAACRDPPGRRGARPPSPRPHRPP